MMTADIKMNNANIVMYTPVCPKQELMQYPFTPQDVAQWPLQRDVIPQILYNVLQPQQGLSSNNNSDSTIHLARVN